MAQNRNVKAIFLVQGVEPQAIAGDGAQKGWLGGKTSVYQETVIASKTI